MLCICRASRLLLKPDTQLLLPEGSLRSSGAPCSAQAAAVLSTRLLGTGAIRHACKAVQACLLHEIKPRRLQRGCRSVRDSAAWKIGYGSRLVMLITELVCEHHQLAQATLDLPGS